MIDDFSQIPPFTRSASYRCDMSWKTLEQFVTTSDFYPAELIELDPEFQRHHVWCDAKRSAYVEYILRGGMSARDTYWNCATWQSNSKENAPLYLVDGKQRIESVRRFMRSEIPAFGTLYRDFKGKFPILGPAIVLNVNNLKSYREVLQWYIDLNTGGVVHTDDEIEKVRKLLAANAA